MKRIKEFLNSKKGLLKKVPRILGGLVVGIISAFVTVNLFKPTEFEEELAEQELTEEAEDDISEKKES